MNTYTEIIEQHKHVVKEMGVLEQNLDLSPENLKEISFDLGVTPDDWNFILQEAELKFSLAQQHLSRKSFDSAIETGQEALLLNPYLYAARGIVSKGWLLRALNENDDSLLENAEKQAELTLEKAPQNSAALEVLATVSSKKRVTKKDAIQITNKKLFLGLAAALLIGGIAVIIYTSSFANNVSSETKSKVEMVEKQLESAFEKQEALIPKVKTLIKGSNNEDNLLNQITKIESNLSKTDVSIEERYEVNNKLNKLLSEIIYDASFNQDSPLLKDIRVLLEGAENRIKTERKNYNEAVQQYNNEISNETQFLKQI
jgi:LemA protein